MKIVLLSIVLLMMSGISQAGDFFTNWEMRDLQLVEVNIDEGRALIRDGDANEMDVYIGDTIGVQRGLVIEMDRGSIIVQIDNTISKMLLVHGFANPQQ